MQAMNSESLLKEAKALLEGFQKLAEQIDPSIKEQDGAFATLKTQLLPRCFPDLSNIEISDIHLIVEDLKNKEEHRLSSQEAIIATRNNLLKKPTKRLPDTDTEELASNIKQWLTTNKALLEQFSSVVKQASSCLKNDASQVNEKIKEAIYDVKLLNVFVLCSLIENTFKQLYPDDHLRLNTGMCNNFSFPVIMVKMIFNLRDYSINETSVSEEKAKMSLEEFSNNKVVKYFYSSATDVIADKMGWVLKQLVGKELIKSYFDALTTINDQMFELEFDFIQTQVEQKIAASEAVATVNSGVEKEGKVDVLSAQVDQISINPARYSAALHGTASIHGNGQKVEPTVNNLSVGSTPGLFNP